MADQAPLVNYDLFLFAGETSGDLHGEALLKELLSLRPHLKVCGVGGPRMRALPFHCLIPMERFQVMGFIDVFIALPRMILLFYTLARMLLQLQPKAALFIDYPGFNLRMERHLKKKGFTGKIIHYICPSVWAWGKSRIKTLKENVDLLLSIFPFEKSYFPSSFPIRYVGNPLVYRLQKQTYAPFPWAQGRKVLALFPGSRKKEIELNFPKQLSTLKKILANDRIGAVSVSQESFIPLLTHYIKQAGLTLGQEIYLVPPSRSYDLMKQAYLAIAKSGTVTLELALHKVPTIVVFGVSTLDFLIAWHLLRIRLPFYCLVNILLGKEVFPELFAIRFTEEALLHQVEKLFLPPFREKILTLCEEVIRQLGSKKASQEAAKLILSKIKER